MPPTPKVTPTNVSSVAQSANNRINALLPNIASTASPITVWTTNVIYEMIALATPPTNTYSPAYYPSSGTWTCPSGVSSVQVECWGGGGGGGGGNTTSGGGGGGGGEYAAEQNYPVVPGEQYAYTCGDGGTNGLTGVPGTTGQNTVFDLQGVGKTGGIIAHGGQGGDITSTGKGGAGGTGSANTTVYAGGPGGTNANGVGDDSPYSSPLANGTQFWYIMDDDPAYYSTIQDNTEITSAQQINTIGTANSTILGNSIPNGGTVNAPAQAPTSSIIGQLYQANVGWSWTAPSSTEMPYYRINNYGLSTTSMTFSCWIYADAGGNFTGSNVSAGTIVSTYDYAITTKSPGYALFIDTNNRVNFKISRHNGSSYTTQLLTLSTPVDTTDWNYIVVSYNGSTMYIYVYNSSNPGGLSTSGAGPSGTGNQVQVNNNSTYFGINPSINGPDNGFSGYMSNLWMATGALTTSTWPNGVYNPSTTPNTGCGGGASGGGGGVGGTGSPGSVGGAGGAGGTVPAVPAGSNLTIGYTGTTGGASGLSGINPASNSYGGGGGGAGNFSPLPTLKTMKLVAAQSASYAGPDAVSNPSGQYTISLAPLVTNSSEKLSTSAANLSPDCYQGGQAQVDSNYQGTMSSAVLLPNAATTAANFTGAIATISKLTMSAEILSPNAASLLLGYTSDTTLPSTFTASSVTTVTELPIPAGSQNTVVSWDLTNNSNLVSAIEGGTACTLIFGPGNTPGAASYSNTATASQFSAAFIGAGGAASGYLQDLTITVQYSSSNWANGGYGSPGAVRIAYINPNGVPIASIQPVATTDSQNDQYAAGFTGPITAWQPGSSPKVPETPHALSSYLNSWTRNSTSQDLQYQMMGDGTVLITGRLNVPASPAAVSTITSSIPSAYWPLNRIETGPATAANSVSPFACTACSVQIDTSGNFSAVGLTSSQSGYTLNVNFRYPLNNLAV
jgi:hypothetical protein